MAVPYEQHEVLLDVQDVSLKMGKGDKEKLILRDVNVQVRNIVVPGTVKGQIVGFLGPSGVGKTKLFEILAGIRKPTTGNVLAGFPLEPVKLGKVGVVQQNYPLFDHRTVWKNLLIAAKLCKGCVDKEKCKGCGKEKEQKVADLLGRFGLWDKKDQHPDELSGGQRQRVAIAQQLMSAEHFLLLDEPFSGLDINMTKEVSKMLVEIANQDERNTIIIVSHDIPATAAISDHLWVMGRDREPDGSVVPGAYIKHKFDLAEMGLAWEQSSHENPAFTTLLHQVRSLFPTL